MSRRNRVNRAASMYGRVGKVGLPEITSPSFGARCRYKNLEKSMNVRHQSCYVKQRSSTPQAHNTTTLWCYTYDKITPRHSTSKRLPNTTLFCFKRISPNYFVSNAFIVGKCYSRVTTPGIEDETAQAPHPWSSVRELASAKRGPA